MAVQARYRRFCWILFVAVTACTRQSSTSSASRGETDADAPIQATASIVINSSPSDVWRVLANIQRWPEWEHDIRAVTVTQNPAVGVAFRWSTAGGTIHSRITLFEPSRRIAWTGHLLVFHAVHVWKLHMRPDGRTSVETSESMTGWPISWVYSSKELLEADQRWLAALKQKVES